MQNKDNIRIRNHFDIKDFIVYIVTIFNCIATVAIAFYTIKLSEFSRNQTREMSIQSDLLKESMSFNSIQAKSSVDQAVYSNIANIQNEENAKKQIRAYLVFDGLDLGNFQPVVQLKNVGQTPALSVTTHTRAMITDKATIEKFLSHGIDNFSVENDDNEYRSVIGSGSIYKYTVQKEPDEYIEGSFKDIDNFSKNDIDNFENGRKLLWFSGHVLYEDIFKEAHVTLICLYFEKGKSISFCRKNNEVR